MKILFTLMLFTSSVLTAGTPYYFTTTVAGKQLAIKPNEYCRSGGFNPEKMDKRCIKRRNGFFCQMTTESYIVSFYDTKEKCRKYLDYAREINR